MHSLRFPSNWELSNARADAVASLLGDGIARDHLTVAGRGQADPIASNDTPAGRDANRRTELIVSNVALASTLAAEPAPPALAPLPAPVVVPEHPLVRPRITP